MDEALRRRTAHFAAKRDALFELELYLVVLYEGWTSTGRRWSRSTRAFAEVAATPPSASCSPSAVTTVLADQLTRAVAHLHQKAQAFTTQLADTVAPTLLAKGDAFRVLRRLLNYSPHKAEGAP